jgi:hypothetical protein
MTCSTDLAVWHGSTGARQRPLTGTPDLRVNGEVRVVSGRAGSSENNAEQDLLFNGGIAREPV